MLAPSAGSLIGSVVFAVGIVAFHMLLLSQQADLLLPHFTGTMNDQLAEVYATAVLGPIDRAFDSSLLSTLTTAFVWGVVGWVIYAVVDYLVVRSRELRNSNRDITVPLKNQVVHSPLHHQIVIRLLWRFLMGLLLILLTVLLQPVVAKLFEQDVLFLRADSPFQMLRHIGISLGGWLIILHVYVMLFRLFVLRTRVFGEIIY